MSFISTHNAREIPIQGVTVFTDRAEIIRKFQVSLKSGTNEIRLENVAGSVATNSIRVDGTGKAVIVGLKFKAKPVNFDEIDLPKVKELRTQLKAAQKEVQKERDLQSILTARVEALNNAVKTIGQSSTKGDSSNLVSFNEDAEVAMDNFFGYHERRSLELKEKLREVEEKIRERDGEVNRLTIQLNQFRWMTLQNVISIELDNQAGEYDAEIIVTYQVYGARWYPLYDIRVQSSKDNHEMNLTYFGKIQQQTGEDWTDVDLVLSTAQPALGGDLPKLGTTVVKFKPPPPRRMRYQNINTFGANRFVNTARCSKAGATGGPKMAPMAKMAHVVTAAADNLLSTTFTIPNKKTIPSDTAEHKVTITIETLTAHLNYHCVPKKDTNVFLMATIINNTDFPIVSGQATVYLNNSMSALINLKSTACGDKLECPLGVDKTVKVVYKPTHKFMTQAGLINKTAAMGNEQKIVVKNHKRAESILITLHEPIPKSSDEKIKVTLLSPDVVKKNAKHEESTTAVQMPSAGAELDDLNNLIWTAKVGANSEKDFVVKWSVEYPPSETLEYDEEFEKESAMEEESEDESAEYEYEG